MRVIKIGGKELVRPAFVAGLAQALRALDEPVVLAHGGGKAVDALQARLGIEPVKVAGMRCTDEDSLPAVLMALCGEVSSRLVAGLIAGGVDALGLSGVDGGLMRCRKLHHPETDLGLVGEIVEVRADLLRDLLARGLTPVVAPVSLGLDDRIYNVNADQAASALARALGVEVLEFVSDVPGVLVAGKITPRLTPPEVERLIAQGEIHNGMVPKVQAALEALTTGVPRVRIVNLQGLVKGGGTLIAVRGMQTMKGKE